MGVCIRLAVLHRPSQCGRELGPVKHSTFCPSRFLLNRSTYTLSCRRRNNFLPPLLIHQLFCMPSGHHSAIQLGGKRAVVIFAVCLVAFVVETQLAQVRLKGPIFQCPRTHKDLFAQYVQAQLDFRQPYLILQVLGEYCIIFVDHVLTSGIAISYIPPSRYHSLYMSFTSTQQLNIRSLPY